MALPSFDTKEALDAALPKLAELVPGLTAESWVEQNGKLVDKDLHTERGKRATVIQEKKMEEELRKTAERERDEAATRLAGLATGETQEKLDAFAKPLRDQITAKDTAIAEKDAKILKLTRDTKAIALIAPLVIDKRFVPALRADYLSHLAANDKDELVVLDANGNVTAEDPAAYTTRWINENEFVKATDPADGGGGRPSTHGAKPPAAGKQPTSSHYESVAAAL